MASNVRKIVVGIGLAGLIAVLTPIWWGYDRITRLAGRTRRGRTVEVARVNASEIDLAELVARDEPVVVVGLLDELDLPTPPTLAGLRDLDARKSASFTVKTHKRHSPYFLYVGDYGAELDSTADRDLGAFLDDMFERPADPDRCTYKLFGVNDVDGGIGEIIDDMAAALATATGRKTSRQASGIWIGSEGAVTPLHHDAWTGLLFQTEGSKRVAMYSPRDRTNLYFSSPFEATSRWSRLPGRSAEASLDDFPLIERAMRHETQLHAGEALFIPPYWSHEIEALEANISIPFRFASRPVDKINPGFLRPAFEVFHGKFLAAS